MVLVTILLGGLLGGFFGGLGALLIRKLEPERKKKMMGVVAGVSGGLTVGLAPAIAQSKLGDEIQVALGVTRRAEIVLKRALEPVLAEPALQREMKGKSAAEVQAHSARLTAEGIASLDAASLERWATLRARLANVSPTLCTAMWRGGIAPKMVIDALDALSLEEQEQWASLSGKAMLIALNPNEPKPARPVTLAEGIGEVVAVLPEAERQAFLEDSVKPNLSDSRACELAKMLFTGATHLAPERRTAFYRALAAGS